MMDSLKLFDTLINAPFTLPLRLSRKDKDIESHSQNHHDSFVVETALGGRKESTNDSRLNPGPRALAYRIAIA